VAQAGCIQAVFILNYCLSQSSRSDIKAEAKPLPHVTWDAFAGCCDLGPKA
jgi:hypothetical protein